MQLNGLPMHDMSTNALTSTSVAHLSDPSPTVENDAVSNSSAKQVESDPSSPTPRRRKSTITLAAVTEAIKKVEESDEVVKEELEKATLFAGKTMTKEDLKKLQVKLGMACYT